MDGTETLEQMHSRHRKEAKDLQGRITNKKKNATKKTRKGVNDECAEMEKQMKERQADEIRKLNGEAGAEELITEEEDENDDEPTVETQIKGDGAGLDNVGDKLNKLKLDELATKQPPQEGGGGGGGKKRNRQKERLARRAAEQEAAAIQAEEEAANMTDHRAIEKTYMLAEFKKYDLEEHEIRPDGHCLFSAVADQLSSFSAATTTTNNNNIPLGGNEGEPGYKTVRRRAAEYIGSHGDEYAGFLEEDLGSYVAKIRDTAEWGGQLELSAIANVYGVEIHVIQDRDTEVVGPTTGAAGGEEEEKKKIWLAYYRHGYGLGEHYNSLRKKQQA